MEPVHRSVLVEEVLTYLALESENGLFVDGTLGEGGHSACFLQRFPAASVIGVDADRVMLGRARERLGEEGSVTYECAWFDEYFASTTGSFDRVLLDLGVSMYHFAGSNRGFSMRSNEPLDMRLNSETGRSAADLVNELDEQALADIIFRYGEERYSRRIAYRIVASRAAAPVATAAQLAEIVSRAVPAAYRHGRIHPATRTFQALRIAVNDELGRIERAIPLVLDRLREGGRLAVISFHSLEDRIVKHAFRELAIDGPYRVLTRKPIVPTEVEVHSNPASRSAKLRVIERITEAA